MILKCHLCSFEQHNDRWRIAGFIRNSRLCWNIVVSFLFNFNVQVQYPGIPSSLSAALAKTNVTTGSPAISAGFYHEPALNAQYTPYSSYSPFQHSPSLPHLQPNPAPQSIYTPPFHGNPLGQGHHQEQHTGQVHGGYSCRQELFPPSQQ